ncbi:VanZ family protein [Chloroflexota bacterium]
MWLRRHPWIQAWLPVLIWMGSIFFLSAQAKLPHVMSGWAGLVISCGTHVLLFAVLAILWMRALGDRPHAWMIAFFVTAPYGLSDEFRQSFVPGRDVSLMDLTCDVVGAGAVGLLLDQEAISSGSKPVGPHRRRPPHPSLANESTARARALGAQEQLSTFDRNITKESILVDRYTQLLDHL